MSTTEQNNTLIIGANGYTAHHLVKQLHEAGHQLTLLVRSLPEARELYPFAGLRFIQGDMGSVQDLEEALEGQERVFLNLEVMPWEKEHDFHTETGGLDILMPLLKKHTIKRLMYKGSHLIKHPSDWWVLQVKRAAAQKVKLSEIPYTIYYCSAFMELLDERLRYGYDLQLNEPSVYPQYFLASEDLARLVVATAHLEGNHAFVVQGPEALTLRQAAIIYAKNYLAAPLTVRATYGLEQKAKMLLKPELQYHKQLTEIVNTYREDKISADSWKEMGAPATTVAEYAKGLADYHSGRAPIAPAPTAP